MRFNHRPLAMIFVGMALTAVAVLTVARLRAGAQTALPQIQGVPAAQFQTSAFDAPTDPASMTPDQVTSDLARVVDLQGHSISMQYTGWTAPGLFRRPAHTSTGPVGPLNGTPFGHLNVWKVTIDLTTTDPGGAQACPAGSTASTCPGMRVFHHMVFIIDDSTGQLEMASPY